MPIYEYKADGEGCEHCRDGFEIRQSISAKPVSKCPKCQAPVKRLVSRFRACVVETSDEVTATEKKIGEFEKEGRWSHAAELADKAGLEDRAKEDYKKAGYDM
jgi:putative FmdB family regulatory protein